MNQLKLIDKLIGTPLCYLFGVAVRPKPLPAPNQIRRIAMIKLVAMGDLITLMPAVERIRRRYPEAEIIFLTTPAMVSLAAAFPFIDRVIPIRFSITGLLAAIHSLRDFDLVIEFDHYYRLPSLLTFWAGVPHRVGFDIPGQGRNLLLTARVRYQDELHAVENFAQLAKAVGAEITDLQLIPPNFATAAADHASMAQLLASHNMARLVVIHPGTSATAKSRRWPAAQFAKLADRLADAGYQIIFTGATEEQPIVEQILALSRYSHLSLVGQTSLGQLLELFRQAKLVVSLDTGPMHLAAASGTPTLGLFGANTPNSWGPYGSYHRAIYHGPIIPCTQQQYGKVCRHPEGYHMGDIAVDEVFQAALEMLQHPL